MVGRRVELNCLPAQSLSRSWLRYSKGKTTEMARVVWRPDDRKPLESLILTTASGLTAITRQADENDRTPHEQAPES